jgi:capsular exopolysaccharide synthesis family protein
MRPCSAWGKPTLSDTPDSSARQTNPTLSDYARSLWRRKAIVIAGLAAGLALGIAVFPRILPSSPDYEARTRLDVRPLTLESQDGTKGDSSGSAQPAGSAALAPDLQAAQAAIDELGPRARRLGALKPHDRSRWPTKLAAAMRSAAIPGTTQVQVSFADDDPALARTTLQTYVENYAQRRNSQYERQLAEIIGTLSNEARRLEGDVKRWSNQADQERGRGGGVSVSTSTQLDLAKERYAAKVAQIDDVNRTAALNPTQILDKTSVVPSDNAGNSGMSLALGLLIGIMAAVGFALLAEATTPKIVTPMDIQMSTGLSVLATVPKLPRRRRGRGSGIIVVDRPFSPSAEGYRQVGTALERQGLGNDIKVLAIISADPGDGKSLLAANLAHSLARQGREVVLVSGDLRRPQVEKLLGLKQRAGLAEALRDDPIPAITMLLSIKECLLLLPAGMPTKHPGELLASRRLAEIIAELRQLGSIVILDTPPVRLSADAITLAGVADAIVLVARSGTTRMRSLREATSGLRRDRIRQLGVVLVGTSSPILRSRRYSYYREHPDLDLPEPMVHQSRPVQLSPRPAPRPTTGGKGDQRQQEPVDAEVTDLSAAAERNRRAAE